MVMKAYLIVGERSGKFPYSNSLLVKTSSNDTILVDAGAGTPLREIIGKIDLVVITHYQPDHIRFLNMIRGKKVYAPAYDTAYRSLVELAKRFAPPVWRTWYEMAQSLGVPQELPEPMVYEEGDIIHGIEPILLPGHLRSHHALLIGETLFGADMDLTSFGPWYGNPESSLEGIIADACVIAELAPKIYYSSHIPYTVKKEQLPRALVEYIDKVFVHAERILTVLDIEGPLKPEKLVGKGLIYPRHPSTYRELYMFFEESMIGKLLEYLSAAGVAYKSRQGYTVHSGWRERLEELRNKTLGIISDCWRQETIHRSGIR